MKRKRRISISDKLYFLLRMTTCCLIADNQIRSLLIEKENYYYYQAARLLDQRPLSAVVHLVVESASVA
jgi:hypothetical protein